MSHLGSRFPDPALAALFPVLISRVSPPRTLSPAGMDSEVYPFTSTRGSVTTCHARMAPTGLAISCPSLPGPWWDFGVWALGWVMG